MNGELPDAHTWWRHAVVYQIYPRSFADSDGDGIGDLLGIVSRVDYLADLGIDAVWLSPFYPSPLADGGYDVADPRGVDPRLGSLADFDSLVAALHDRGIRLVVDIVPNHTSEQHPWFQQALTSPPGSPERDRYHFRDAPHADPPRPPSDWVSQFGGPAWTQVADGQWYLHTFASEQPDLNWSNDDVRDDYLETLRFWSDRGVDGFRVDVAHLLTKDLTEPLPTAAELAALPRDGHHPTEDRDDVHEVYARWRELFDSYDPPRTAVAEAWVEPHRVPRYASAASLGQAFNFDLLEAAFDADGFRAIVSRNLDLAEASGSSSTWVLSNHDIPRHPTRYGMCVSDPDAPSLRTLVQAWMLDGAPSDGIDREQGLRRARAATLLMLALPGSAYLYQGEELGLDEVTDIPADLRQDPSFFRSGGRDIGRDGARVPIPWSPDGPSYGFGPGAPHLPQPASFADLAVSVQQAQPESTLALYTAALALRKQLQGTQSLRWLDGSPPEVLHAVRPGGWEVVTNFGTTAQPMPLTTADVVLASGPIQEGWLPAETTLWLRCG